MQAANDNGRIISLEDTHTQYDDGGVSSRERMQIMHGSTTGGHWKRVNLRIFRRMAAISLGYAHYRRSIAFVVFSKTRYRRCNCFVKRFVTSTPVYDDS